MTEFRYRFYGLTLASNQPLPGLQGARAALADVRLEVLAPGSIPFPDLRWVMPDPPQVLWRAETEQGSYLRLHYEGLDAAAEFVIDAGGSNVWASWSAGVAIEEAAELVLGPVFSCVLGQRGATCLHAGVVTVEDRTIGLVGPSGTGKSSTSMTLLGRGGTLISDDIAVLEDCDGKTFVRVGEPRVRMRPDSAAALCGSFESLRPMWVHEELRPAKRYADVGRDGSIADDRVPLDAIYLLGPRGSADEPAVRALAATDALPRLMANRHNASVLERRSHLRDFERLARLVEELPVRELVRPEGLHAAERTADVLLADARALG